jgi:hypothetical protein
MTNLLTILAAMPGTAEEPALAVPLVIAFVVICAIAAIIMARGGRTDA